MPKLYDYISYEDFKPFLVESYERTARLLGVTSSTVISWVSRKRMASPAFRLLVACKEIPGFKEWLRKRF